MTIELESSINWLVFSSNDVDDARKILKDLDVDSTVDSMGLGAPVEAISNVLFPATSTLHTRLRYQLFVSAIFSFMYQDSQKKKKYNSRKTLHRLENKLRILLEKNEKKGVIGSTNGEKLKAWPSQTYWGAINTMKLLGDDPVERSKLHDVIDAGKKNKIKDGDEGHFILEGKSLEIDTDIDKVLKKIISHDRELSTKMKFDLTRSEARLFLKLFSNIEVGPFTLSNHWITGNRYSSTGIEKIIKFEDIKRTGNKMIDSLIIESKNYSRLAKGILFAYRYTLCEYKIKCFSEKKNVSQVKEWKSYSKGNLVHFENWMKSNNDLLSWDIEDLVSSISSYNIGNPIDKPLKTFVHEFQNLCLKSLSTKKTLLSMKDLIEHREKKLRPNKSHFKGHVVSIPDNVKNDTYSDYLYNYRFLQGRQNVIDILKGLGR